MQSLVLTGELILFFYSYNISCRMCVAIFLPDVSRLKELTEYSSCQNANAAQQKISRGQEAAMATIRQAMVCRMYHLDHWQFCQSRDQYVFPHQFLPHSPWSCAPSSNAWIGFVAFDQYKSLLADENGKMSGPKTVLAGFGAGVTESLLAVTPTESIKTTL